MGITDIAKILEILYDLFKPIHKTDLEKFEKEWEHDYQEFLKALQAHDSATLAMLISKYSGDLL